MNENVYTGSLARHLRSDGLLMEEQTLHSTSQEAPHSHQTGQVAIVGIFMTPGIICSNSYLSLHGAGVGNHRFQVHDFNAHLVLGTEYPTTVRPSGRALRCKVFRTVTKYNEVLKQLLIHHRSFKKMEYLQQNRLRLSPAEFQLLFNQWDWEVTCLMLGLEHCRNKFRDGSIEFSPVVGLWLCQMQLYWWIRRYHEGRVQHAGNLFWTCRRLNVPNPNALTPKEMATAEKDCKRRLESLKAAAPKLQDEHLRTCLGKASARGNAAAVKSIIGILRSKSTRCCWRSLRRAVNPDRGGAVTRLRVQTDGGDLLYATRDEVEQQAANHIGRRYKTAEGAPIIQDLRLHWDFGFLADKAATDRVLQGTYAYPTSMDPYTKLLLQEAHHIFSRMSEEEVVDFVTTTDFQHFWLHAKEDIQSPESGVHFGHYKAAAHDWYLSALQAAKLTLAATTGVPLARWGNGLTVLLEKFFGNIYIDKMQAICLLEADYNWLNKYVFAKRMIDRAFQEDIVPVKQFAKQGSQAPEGGVASGLFCDIARALHRTAAIESVDFANCYDTVSHPIASIALQSFKVRKVMIAMMLSVLQTMKWYLKTAFGQSLTFFGGSQDDPSMGFGQGNGAAPPGFLAVSALLIKAYRRQGHGAWFTPGLARDAFILAAVIYVNDSNLLHLAQGTPTDAEFCASVQAANC
jgi:hypothetical protein